jgi:hypothetical protein
VRSRRDSTPSGHVVVYVVLAARDVEAVHAQVDQEASVLLHAHPTAAHTADGDAGQQVLDRAVPLGAATQVPKLRYERLMRALIQ